VANNAPLYEVFVYFRSGYLLQLVESSQYLVEEEEWGRVVNLARPAHFRGLVFHI